MLNKAILMGRLVADPELRQTQSGTPVASFRIACDRNVRAGEQKQADFIDIVAWNRTAEFVKSWFTKGKMIVVVGRIQVRDWEDKTGQKRRSFEIVADEVQFAESKRSESEGAAGGSQLRPQAAPSGSQFPSGGQFAGGNEFAALDGDDSDLPF